jgi:hypothetical protein
MIVVLKQCSNLREIQEAFGKISKMKPAKAIDAKKYCGVLKLKEQPIDTQKKMRDEWD